MCSKNKYFFKENESVTLTSPFTKVNKLTENYRSMIVLSLVEALYFSTNESVYLILFIFGSNVFILIVFFIIDSKISHVHLYILYLMDSEKTNY